MGHVSAEEEVTVGSAADLTPAHTADPRIIDADTADPRAADPDTADPDTADPGAVDPRLVDADVADAVGRALADVLGARVAAAREIDPVFARDIAGRAAGFTLDGGKRMRSRFLWWGMRACGGGTTREAAHAALRLAAALEILQTCALVHDDVMDGSGLRRGAPAVHADVDAQYAAYAPARRADASEPFGRAAAILVGDLALAWADDTVGATRLPTGTGRQIRATWQAMRAEMVAGQYLDLHGQATGSRSTDQAIRAACLKSARYSVERPLALGAALAGADEHTTRALRSAGRCAGIAFQLHDDLLGAFGNTSRTGKPSGEDIRSGKPTYLAALAWRRAEARGDRRAADLLGRAARQGGLTDAEVDEVRKVFETTGARALVEARISRLVGRGAQHLAVACEADDPAHRRLLDLFHRIAGLPPAGRSGGPGTPADTDRTGLSMPPVGTPVTRAATPSAITSATTTGDRR
jgi:geranylgeranyl diphosphate synthase type I